MWRSLVAHLTGGQGVAGSNPVIPTSFTEFFRFPVGGLTGVSHATATPLARSNSLRHLTQLFEYPIIRPSLARQRTQPKNHVDPPAVVSALPRRSFCARGAGDFRTAHNPGFLLRALQR